MRKALADEFSAIHIYNLRGNQRTAGEQSRKEGGKVFGGGSRATVAITVLVKNPDRAQPATIHYTDVGDYLSREAKLAKVRAAGSAVGLDSAHITANEHGDWLHQRREDFGSFLTLCDPRVPSVFGLRSSGVKTNRDAWTYNFDVNRLLENMARAITFFNEQSELFGRSAATSAKSFVDRDASKFSWDRADLPRIERGEKYVLDREAVRSAVYRPFMREWLYLDRRLNNTVYQQFRVYPTKTLNNQGFYLTAPGTPAPFSVIAVDSVPEHVLHGAGNPGQMVPRWAYEPVEGSGMLDLGVEGEVIDGYRKIDNVTDQALARFRGAYSAAEITKDSIFFYVYGLLHSPEYRETYAADLKKMLPRIPFVRDFRGYADAGRALSDLHLGYESVGPYPLEGLATKAQGDPYAFYGVGTKKMTFGKASAEQRAAGERYDRTVIHYNERITLSGIPLEAYRYLLGSRSAIEWIIDRYHVKTDKASGIVNDPNDWSREIGDPRYILDLLARIVTVSLETNKIVDSLPPLDILDGE